VADIANPVLNQVADIANQVNQAQAVLEYNPELIDYSDGLGKHELCTIMCIADYSNIIRLCGMRLLGLENHPAQVHPRQVIHLIHQNPVLPVSAVIQAPVLRGNIQAQVLKAVQAQALVIPLLPVPVKAVLKAVVQVLNIQRQAVQVNQVLKVLKVLKAVNHLNQVVQVLLQPVIQVIQANLPAVNLVAVVEQELAVW
jgi:hypothetical protein